MAQRNYLKAYPRKYQYGMQLLFRGEHYTLKPIQKGYSKLDHQERSILINEKHQSSDAIKNEIIKLYKNHFVSVITDELSKYQPRYNVAVNTVRIKKLKSRWGSCSSLMNLNFNMNLMLAPVHIIRYVVIHELCHLVHMNHSKSFWETVALECPTWKEDRAWLKTNGHLLNLDFEIK